jgi:hypothetical protein
MSEGDPLACGACGNTREETTELGAPEWCGCCEEVLCEVCWMRGHVVTFAPMAGPGD